MQSAGDPVRHRHLVVSVLPGSIRPLEHPSAYEHVPRRTLGKDGHIRPWTRQLQTPTSLPG